MDPYVSRGRLDLVGQTTDVWVDAAFTAGFRIYAGPDSLPQKRFLSWGSVPAACERRAPNY